LALVATPGADTEVLLSDLRRRFWPNKLVALRSDPAQGDASLSPMFEGKHASPAGPTLYVCEHFACQEPVVGQEEILATWEQLAAEMK